MLPTSNDELAFKHRSAYKGARVAAAVALERYEEASQDSGDHNSAIAAVQASVSALSATLQSVQRTVEQLAEGGGKPRSGGGGGSDGPISKGSGPRPTERPRATLPRAPLAPPAPASLPRHPPVMPTAPSASAAQAFAPATALSPTGAPVTPSDAPTASAPRRASFAEPLTNGGGQTHAPAAPAYNHRHVPDQHDAAYQAASAYQPPAHLAHVFPPATPRGASPRRGGAPPEERCVASQPACRPRRPSAQSFDELSFDVPLPSAAAVDVRASTTFGEAPPQSFENNRRVRSAVRSPRHSVESSDRPLQYTSRVERAQAANRAARGY